MKYPGIKNTTRMKKATKTYTWNSAFWIKVGKAIPTANEPYPSGFPYLAKLSLAFSSVMIVYALVI
jgi:hypothetical protein